MTETDLLKGPKYWAWRWRECFPNTYPPELYDEVTITRTSGWWIFKKTYTITKAFCRRCGMPLSTSHMCADVVEYLKEEQREVLRVTKDEEVP